MFDDIIERIKQIMASRLIPITIVLIVLFSVLINRLFQIQIIDGEDNSDVASMQDVRTTYTKASRGLIRGANGEVLADNKLVYTVELYDVLSTNKEKNDMIAYLLETLKEYGNEIEVTIPISYENGEFEYTARDNELKTFMTNAFGQGKLSEENAEATAEEVFEYMRNKRFYVDEKFSVEEAIDIIALRYGMYIMWPPQNPVTVCSDVDEKTVVAIKEREPQLTGVNIGQKSIRYYIEENEPFAHILGYTGLINEAELESYQNQAIDKYDSSDNIGKVGVESSFEDILSGEKGINEVSIDGLGKPQEVINTKDPVAGSDIYLTIDPDLQRAVYQLTEQKLSGILLSKINNSKNPGTKGVSSSDIRIPIYDVYFAFINNEIINTSHFRADDATELEEQVYSKFESKIADVFTQLDTILATDSTKTNKELSDEMNEYISHIYRLISSEGMLDRSKVDRQDNMYSDYVDDDISLSEYLQYAITKNWVDLDKLDIDNEYYDTKEIYLKIIDYLKELLESDTQFHKLIYYYLIDTYKLSGTEICLLLFDQGVLEYNEDEVAKLRNGNMSSYTFVTNRIRNLDIKPSQLGLEPFSASVIVSDVRTGKVLSMVSYPSYDSNNYVNYLANNITSPLYPRAVREAIAPGSTFKMVSAVAGLEENVITPYEKILDQYYFTKINEANPPRCNFNNHGSVNVVEALEVSCNYFFYELGYRLATTAAGYDNSAGLEILGQYAMALGLGQGGNTNLEKELSTTSNTSIANDDTIRGAIGQGNSIFTPAELSTYVTTIANSGKRFDLTLIDKIYDGEQYVENEADYIELEDISDTTWNYVQQGMYRVANGSRGSTRLIFQDLNLSGINIAGKTGTAQIGKNNANHALFVSYGPFENPEISVTVVIPNGYTSGNAAELAKEIYNYYFNISDEDTLLSGEAREPEVDTPAISD